MKFKHFNIEDVLSPDDRKQIEKYIGQKGYYADSLESLDHYIEDKKHIDYLYSIEKSKSPHLIIGFSYDYCNFSNYFLPLEKVKKTEQTRKYRSPENRNTFDLWIANKVKVRVVTNIDDFDKTLFSIPGIIKNTDELGVLLINQNNKEHFIPYASIVEIQNLGTDDWPEYERSDVAEILNRPC